MKKYIPLFLLAVMLSLVSCSQSMDDMTRQRLYTLSEAGKLSTAEFTVTKILSASDFAWWKIGERKMLISCKAYLEAGIDMSEYDETKTHIDKASKSIKLTLPPVRLLSLNLPSDEVKVAYERVTGMRWAFTAEERNNVLTQGEADIRADVPQIGILDVARTNADSFFRSMLEELGYEDIIIEFER